MEYKDKVKDFLKRSNDNLEIIKENKGYEFTGLLTNFISALILIRENREISEEPISDNNLTCKKLYNTYHVDFEKNTKEFIKHLRNACCHYRVDILQKKGEIEKVIFEDVNKMTSEECKIELNVADIEKVYTFLMELSQDNT